MAPIGEDEEERGVEELVGRYAIFTHCTTSADKKKLLSFFKNWIMEVPQANLQWHKVHCTLFLIKLDFFNFFC